MRTLLLAGIALFALGTAAQAQAQSWPDRPIKFIVPYAPGGSVDLIARTLGPKVGDSLKQPVIIENRAGAGGQIGVDATAKSAGDGYTFVFTPPGAIAISPHSGKLPYNPLTDLVTVSTVAVVPTAIAVNPNTPVKTFQELMANAKANPGKFSFAVSGIASTTHLATELLKSMGGMDLAIVPYRGTQPATTAIMGGEVQAGVSDLTTLLPLAKDNRVRIIAVVDEKRTVTAPDIPTVAESGIPGYAASGWISMFAPAATPAPIVERMNAEIARIVGEQDVKAVFMNAGMEPSPRSVAASKTFIAGEHKKWGDVIKSANIKLD